MTYTVQISPAAEADISRIVSYYSEIAPQAVVKFEGELRQLKVRLQQFPLSFPQYSLRLRQAILFVFPYNVYYEIQGLSVMIAAILPQRFGSESLGGRLLH